MKISKEKMSALVITLLIVAVPLIQTSEGTTVNSSTIDKTSAFLSDVVGLDLTKYNVTNERYSFGYPSYYGGEFKEETLFLDLVSSDSNISVMGRFLNGFIYGIFVYPPTNGSMFFKNQPSTNAVDESRNILQRYKTFAEDYGLETSHIDSALTLLNNATRASSLNADLHMFNNITGFVPSVTYAGNVKQETKQRSITWIYTVNGVDMSFKGATIDFGANELHFADTWNLFTVGSFSVISEDEAKNIGWDAAQNYNLTFVNENGTSHSVIPKWSNVSTISLNMVPGQFYNRDPDDHFVSAGNATRDPLGLYPHWKMVFYFDRIGNTYGIQVGVWGDTTEIAYISPVGSLGALSGGNPDTTTSTESSATQPKDPAESENSNPPPLNILLIGGIVATATTIAGAAVVLKKRRK
jgi:catechol 2,3-dioxygenase-like lactoylglutathione lyase family enzyme